jgi:hypothetical protein
MIRYKKTAVISLGVTALVAIGAVGGAVAADDDPGTIPASTLAVGVRAASQAEVSISPLLQEVKTHYGLDVGKARAASAPTSDKARAASTEPWIIIPGTQGICLDTASGPTACGSDEAFEAGQVSVQSIPAATGPVPTPKDGRVRPEDMIGEGPETVRGVVPDGNSMVIAYNHAGDELSRAPVSQNVYEVSAPAKELGSVRLVRADGSTTVVFDVSR